MVLWMLLAVPLGVVDRQVQRVVVRPPRAGAVHSFLSLPAFWLARMFQYWLSYKLGWFPVAGFRGFAQFALARRNARAAVRGATTPGSFTAT